jgi:hypothetical protein
MGGVGVEVSESWKNARSGRVDNERPIRDGDPGARPDRSDFVSFDEHDTVLDGCSGRTVDDLASDDGENAGCGDGCERKH